MSKKRVGHGQTRRMTGMLARMLWQVWESLAPVFLAIAVGALLRALRFLPDAFFGGLHKLAFWVCLPCLLFHQIAHCQVTVEGAWRMAPWILALTIIPQLLAGWLLAKLLRVPAPSRSAFLQGGMRANLAYVGIPVITFALARNPQAAGRPTRATCRRRVPHGLGRSVPV